MAKQIVGVEVIIDMASEAHFQYLRAERKEREPVLVARLKGRWEGLRDLLND